MLASSYELKNTIPLRFEAYLNVKIPQYPTNKAKTVVIEMEYKMPSIKCKRFGTPGLLLLQLNQAGDSRRSSPFHSFPTTSKSLLPGVGWGDSAYESGGDVRRLA